MTQRRNLRQNAANDQAPSFEHVDADSVEHAIQLLRRNEGARPLAGGNELLTAAKNRFPLQGDPTLPTMLVNVKTIDELYGIRKQSGGGLVIGAATALGDIADSELVQSRAPALAQAAGHVASPQMRQTGTIGGNLAQDSRCWYYRTGFDCYKAGGDTCYADTGDSRQHSIKNKERCLTVNPSDTAPAVVALDAEIEIAGPSGRKRVDARDFFVHPSNDIKRMHILGDDELLTKVVLPSYSLGSNQDFTKVRTRESWDFALVNVATVLPGGSASDARIALNGVAPTPIRANSAERTLRSASEITAQSARQAGEAFAATTNPEPDNAYKVRMSKRLIQQSTLAAAEGV